MSRIAGARMHSYYNTFPLSKLKFFLLSYLPLMTFTFDTMMLYDKRLTNPILSDISY